MLRCVAIGLVTVGLVTVMAVSAGAAADIKVLAALAVQDALDPIATSFARDSGHRAQIAYSTVGAIRQRLAAGERADVVVLTADAIDDMARLGQVSGPTPVAATRTGVAFRDGAVAPDVATLDKLRDALLAARSVAYTDPKSGGAFGTYFSGELDRMGIAQAVNAKAVLRRGSHEVAASVANGEAELGVTFISAIVSTPGTRVAGPLPPPLAGLERFSAGTLPGSATDDAAPSFVRALGGGGAATMWSSAGFEAAAGQR